MNGTSPEQLQQQWEKQWQDQYIDNGKKCKYCQESLKRGQRAISRHLGQEGSNNMRSKGCPCKAINKVPDDVKNMAESFRVKDAHERRSRYAACNEKKRKRHGAANAVHESNNVAQQQHKRAGSPTAAEKSPHPLLFSPRTIMTNPQRFFQVAHFHTHLKPVILFINEIRAKVNRLHQRLLLRAPTNYNHQLSIKGELASMFLNFGKYIDEIIESEVDTGGKANYIKAIFLWTGAGGRERNQELAYEVACKTYSAGHPNGTHGWALNIRFGLECQEKGKYEEAKKQYNEAIKKPEGNESAARQQFEFARQRNNPLACAVLAMCTKGCSFAKSVEQAEEMFYPLLFCNPLGSTFQSNDATQTQDIKSFNDLFAECCESKLNW
eukprot:scaffold7667_cov161-Amphora_coffeaeformis.AAC.7